jgi:superfamily II DNA or RNA helicase
VRDLELPERLWDHQVAAVQTIDQYLKSTDDGESALITMPTGTGKTGVIAASVTFPASLKGHRLVLTPWVALRNQLVDDIASRFWSQLGIPHPEGLPTVKRLPSAPQVAEAFYEAAPTVFVATISALQTLASFEAEEGRNFASLFADFDLVFVDEGHYEPAHNWSETIRSLARPTVILTATPYRNDTKYFRVGGHRYRFRYKEALDARFLRAPKFESLERTSTQSFCTHLGKLVAREFPKGAPPKVIVRCATADAIARVVHTLNNAGQTAIGMHDTFPAGDGVLRRSVPAPHTIDAQYWVHQNKLIEGIDDPSFKVLAFYDSLSNDRAVIQQIGRILRNPKQLKNDMKAVVVGTGDRDAEATWQSYLRFDSQEDQKALATLPELTARILEAQPEVFYYDRRYREFVDLEDPNAWEYFRFPLRTRIFKAIPQRTLPSLDEVVADMRDEWEEIDRIVFPTQAPGDEVAITPFVAAENSPFMLTGTFIEPTFGYTIVGRGTSRLFFYDTRGVTPRCIHERARPVDSSELEQLFPAGNAGLTSVSLRNTDLGRQAVRGRQLRADAIEEVGPDLSDFAFVCTVAEGHAQVEGKRIRRYVGLSRARVADHRPGRRDLDDYLSWLNELDSYLEQGKPIATFARYATQTDEPPDPEPIHVLLDLDSAEFEVASDNGPFILDDTAYEVVDRKLTLSIDGKKAAATLSWRADAGRYFLNAPELTQMGIWEVDGEGREVVSYINQEQALRVVPRSGGAIYSHGNFYKPVVPLNRKGSFRLLDVLVADSAIGAATSEKGVEIVDDGWEQSSLFGMISNLAPGGQDPPSALADLLPEPDLLVCTDLGTEIADFIATGSGKVVFMHAKASNSEHRISASAFHEVSAQAIKNLLYLQPLSEAEPKGKNWALKWKGQVSRQRVGDFAKSDEIWGHVRSMVADPKIDREVWLLVARSLSVGALVEQSRKNKPSAEALQLFSLLQTTWGTVSQLGCRLRIFCSD